jgi:ethanolamine utilization protein EutN
LFLARVIGTVVASVKVPGLDGVKLLVVERLGADGRTIGEPLVACDVDVLAGPGDQVFCVDKREATLALPDPFVPVDAAVVGIVDEVARGVGP